MTLDWKYFEPSVLLPVSFIIYYLHQEADTGPHLRLKILPHPEHISAKVARDRPVLEEVTISTEKRPREKC